LSGRHHDEIEARDVLDEIINEQNAFGLVAAALAHCKQTRQAAPRGAVLRIGEDVGRAIGKYESRADDELQWRDVCIVFGIALADFLVEFLDR
jgi:hypothetical protein